MAKSECNVSGCYESCKWLVSIKQGNRVQSKHCTRHACRTILDYPDAKPCSRVAVPGTKCCEIHLSCTIAGCNYPKILNTQLCYNHTCMVKGCLNQALFDRRCKDHVPCPVNGCSNFRRQRPDGRGLDGACRLHAYKRCDYTGCHETVGLNVTCCTNHLCTVRGCCYQRSFGSNCKHHTCAANGCSFQVAHPDCVGPNRPTCTYCSDHECQTAGCHATATVRQGHCKIHGCKINGCDEAKSLDKSANGYCISHIKEEVYKRAERFGREAEMREAIKRMENEKERQRAREKVERENMERRRLEEEVERLKLENERLQAETASEADHYPAEEYINRDSTGSPLPGFAYFSGFDDGFSHRGQMGSIPRSYRSDDSNSDTIRGTDDYPIPPRRSAPYRYVPGRPQHY